LTTLTDTQLKAWVRAGQPISGKSDGGGLTFSISKAGTASWTLRYRFAGKQPEITLGNYPDLSLTDARKAARELRVQVDRGIHVAREKRKARAELASAGMFRELSEDYMTRVGPSLAATTRTETRRYLKKDILPQFKHLSTNDVTPADVIALVEKIEKRSHWVAHRAFNILSVIFAHGVAKHLAKVNPCASLDISAILGKGPEKRKRIKLSAEELRSVFGALPSLGRMNELAIRIILATCVRKGELLRARWEHVDARAGMWTIPASNSKSGREFQIPLAAIVLEWFEELRELTKGSAWLVPGIAGGVLHPRIPMSRNALNVALRRLKAAARPFSPHDLRSTARSYLAELGVDVLVAERCLNHSLGGLIAVYDQHDYLLERRRALELWASHLQAIESGRNSNVEPMRRAA